MATTKKTSAKQRITTSESLSISDMLMVCVRHWPWFVLSLILFMGGATLYLLSTPKTYTRTTSIMVKNSGDKSNDMRLIEDLGVNNLSSNISDEIVAIHSPAAIYEMVKRLHLDISYFRPGFFRDDPLYANTLPIEIEFDSIADDTMVDFKVKLIGDSTANICPARRARGRCLRYSDEQAGTASLRRDDTQALALLQKGFSGGDTCQACGIHSSLTVLWRPYHRQAEARDEEHH